MLGARQAFAVAGSRSASLCQEGEPSKTAALEQQIEEMRRQMALMQQQASDACQVEQEVTCFLDAFVPLQAQQEKAALVKEIQVMEIASLPGDPQPLLQEMRTSLPSTARSFSSDVGVRSESEKAFDNVLLFLFPLPPHSLCRILLPREQEKHRFSTLLLLHVDRLACFSLLLHFKHRVKLRYASTSFCSASSQASHSWRREVFPPAATRSTGPRVSRPSCRCSQ